MKAVLVATLALACMLGLALGQGYYGYGGQEESSSGGSKLHPFLTNLFQIRARLFKASLA